MVDAGRAHYPTHSPGYRHFGQDFLQTQKAESRRTEGVKAMAERHLPDLHAR
jgi:hypothetical protein